MSLGQWGKNERVDPPGLQVSSWTRFCEEIWKTSLNAQAGSWKTISHVLWERKRHKISWGLCFFSPQKKKEKKFLKIWKISCCFYAVFKWCSFFPLKILIFCDFTKKRKYFAKQNVLHWQRYFFLFEKQFHKIVENLSPKWYKCVNGRSVGSLWEVEDDMEPTKSPTDKQKLSNGPLRIDQSTCHSCSVVFWLT